jgi:plasmid stabilization system protein ParE
LSHGVEFSPEALAELLDLYDYIAVRDGAERAIGDIDRIQHCCHGLSLFPERQGDNRSGLIPTSNESNWPGLIPTEAEPKSTVMVSGFVFSTAKIASVIRYERRLEHARQRHFAAPKPPETQPCEITPHFPVESYRSNQSHARLVTIDTRNAFSGAARLTLHWD